MLSKRNYLLREARISAPGICIELAAQVNRFSLAILELSAKWGDIFVDFGSLLSEAAVPEALQTGKKSLPRIQMEGERY